MLIPNKIWNEPSKSGTSTSIVLLFHVSSSLFLFLNWLAKPIKPGKNIWLSINFISPIHFRFKAHFSKFIPGAISVRYNPSSLNSNTPLSVT